MAHEPDEYRHLLVTPDFEASLTRMAGDSYDFTDAEVDGVFDALDVLDEAPSEVPGQLRLHAMQVERRPWWSITPRHPASTEIRIMVRPEVRGGTGYWIVGPVTRHYRS